MGTELITVDFNREFPVLPLSAAVLLPQAILPLQIYEERYIEMVRDVLDSSGMIAMALFEGRVTTDEYSHGTPPLKKFACIGHVRQYEHLADNRYVLLVQGLCRARIISEVSHEPYRLVRLGQVESAPVTEHLLTPYRHRIEELLSMQIMGEGDEKRLVQVGHGEEVSTPMIVDLAIAAMCTGANQQYKMLSQSDVRVRAEWLIHRMESLLGKSIDDTRRN